MLIYVCVNMIYSANYAMTREYIGEECDFAPV